MQVMKLGELYGSLKEISKRSFKWLKNQKDGFYVEVTELTTEESDKIHANDSRWINGVTAHSNYKIEFFGPGVSFNKYTHESD